MTSAAILREIIAAAKAMTPSGIIRGYLFGSVLKSDIRWADIDILVVCDNKMDVQSVRPSLASVCNRAPIDLLVMSAAEERELNFVIDQGCQPLFQLSVSHP